MKLQTTLLFLWRLFLFDIASMILKRRSLTYVEQLKDEDGDFIVNNDELALNYDASDHFPVPTQNTTESSQPAGKENIYDGDLGLGGYEVHSKPASCQSEFASSA